MKTSNIWSAWISTGIGILITVLTAIGTAYTGGSIDWKLVTAAAIPAAILALTDVLKEKKKELDEQNSGGAK